MSQMVDISALYATVVSNDPAWFFYPEDHYSISLSELAASVVVEAARQLPSAFVPKKRTHFESIKSILLHFSCLRAELGAVSDEALFAHYTKFIKCPLPSVSRLCLISAYIEMLYREVIAAALR
ncbi:uncharacterized protein HD556DRAFT_1441080 [Suillus plorans]|uniref:Uncharacterized protein n=1 Tax=Suillus plorans TaxID=116603 RepID=A0A9P7DL66_9AGAM|nr:uncharacterized protein HD556DRAFT_1441080 [Suillus plorans]KAG1797522.1 hypothetical protein HD556DRAFT_1441080 [Suillus plorans]